MTDTYQPLIEALRELAVQAYLQRPDQLVISRQYGAGMPFSGNSFWVTCYEGTWHVCTWRPACYRLSSAADLVEFCVEFVDVGDSAQPRVPRSLVDKYHLMELSDEEAESLLRS